MNYEHFTKLWKKVQEDGSPICSYSFCFCLEGIPCEEPSVSASQWEYLGEKGLSICVPWAPFLRHHKRSPGRWSYLGSAVSWLLPALPLPWMWLKAKETPSIWAADGYTKQMKMLTTCFLKSLLPKREIAILHDTSMLTLSLRPCSPAGRPERERNAKEWQGPLRVPIKVPVKIAAATTTKQTWREIHREHSFSS